MKWEEVLGYVGGFILALQLFGLLGMWRERLTNKKSPINLEVFKTFKHRRRK